MCPDKEILSVFFDGELDSPWREKLEAHLAACAECRARLAAYAEVRARLLADAALPGEDAARARVWGAQPLSFHERRFGERPWPRRGFWRGSITVPVPAAAGLVLAALLGVFFALRPRPAALPPIARMGTEVSTESATDMEALLEYLNQNSSSDVVVINLPEGVTFQSAGEPLVIRAADYSKQPRPAAGGRK